MELLKKIVYVLAWVALALIVALAVSKKSYGQEVEKEDEPVPVFNIQKADTSVVKITAIDGSFRATGFYVGSDIVITNAHVVIVEGGRFRKDVALNHVLCWDKAGDAVLGKVTFTDEVQDVAVITLIDNDLGLTALKPAKVVPKRGHAVYSVGHPAAQYWAFSKGYVSHKAQEQPDGSLRVTADMQGTFGASGSPIMNARNELVGMMSQVMGAGSGVFYIPLSAFIDQLP